MGERGAARVLVLLGVVAGVGLGLFIVRWGVDETLTRHSAVDPDTSMVVTVRAERNNAAEHDEAELVEALATMCQLEVNGRVDEQSINAVGGSRYTFEVRPSLDDADQRQLEGCLEDVRIDHFLADVVSMEHHDG